MLFRKKWDLFNTQEQQSSTCLNIKNELRTQAENIKGQAAYISVEVITFSTN